MYEIWLMLNILWESLLAAWPAVLTLLLVVCALSIAALARPSADWRGAVPVTVVGAIAVAVAAFVLLPGLTQSSLGELKYWVDWLALAGVAAGFGALAAAVLLPLIALVAGRRGTA